MDLDLCLDLDRDLVLGFGDCDLGDRGDLDDLDRGDLGDLDLGDLGDLDLGDQDLGDLDRDLLLPNRIGRSLDLLLDLDLRLYDG